MAESTPAKTKFNPNKIPNLNRNSVPKVYRHQGR